MVGVKESLEITGGRRIYEGESIINGKRYFTKEGVSPYDEKKWTKSDVPITDDNNNLLFIQRDVEFPEEYSGLTRKVIASRYFYGEKDTTQRESSQRQLIERVTETYGGWAFKQGYAKTREEANIFRDELAYMTINQMFAWNSPVWFNVGTDRYENFPSDEQRDGYVINIDGKAIRKPRGTNNEYPQTSACFIQSVEDTMEDIMDLATREAMLFKHGSGTGTNLSSLRSSREKLSGGGKPSGPLAYLSFHDRVAGIVKSGGRNRRAAKWDGLDITHPDIREFIHAKKFEQRKLNALMDFLGLNYRDAADSVLYQNVNVTVRVTDEFMHAVEEGKKWKTIPVHNKDMVNEMPEYDAKQLWREIAECAWECADPGLQFDTTINEWHTTPKTARINASNPCSEYMQIDDSSCNLSSFNLMKFANEDGSFRTRDFRKGIELATISMDLNYNNSAFPTARIAETSQSIRPLGVGYTNLGSWLMFQGLAYDSNEGRTAAAAVTALMTGQVYLTSTELAEKIGPFKEFEKNRDDVLRVLKKHREAINAIESVNLPKGLEDILSEAQEVWDKTIERAERYGVRNGQATVLAPTGTISFQMGADTFGIEPDNGLVKYKLLAEGGVLKIVNQMVPVALRRLGYDDNQIKGIIDYIIGHEDLKKTPHLKSEHISFIEENRDSKDLEEKIRNLGKYDISEIEDMVSYIAGHKTAEGAPYLKEEHLPIFDCASKPKNATRSISPEAHIKMMAAVQPFVSGAISKTVNLPEDASIDDIEKIHTMAWKSGVKALAVYVQNCKRGEPLSFGDGNFENEEKMIETLRKRGIRLEDHLKPVRRRLPTTRDAKIHKFEFEVGHEGYIHPGFYPDGTLGELFIDMSKDGSMVRGLTASLGRAISLGLQYGVPSEAFISQFRHQKYDPRGLMKEGHPDIKVADSLTDYIAQIMEKIVHGDPQLIPGENKSGRNGGFKKNSEEKENEGEKGGFCALCGGEMIKDGRCIEKCVKCDWIDPKGCGQ